MHRLLLFGAVGLLTLVTAPVALAQQAVSAALPQAVPAPAPDLSASVEEVLLENFDKDDDTFGLISYFFGGEGDDPDNNTGDGWILGTNALGFHEHASFFETPDLSATFVTGVQLWFTNVSTEADIQEIEVSIFSGEGDPVFGSGPEDELASQTLSVLDIAVDETGETVVPTEVRFDLPVEVEEGFFVVLNYGTTAFDDDSKYAVSLGATQGLGTPIINTWARFNNSWAQLDDWIGPLANDFEVYLWIDAFVDPNPVVSNEGDAVTPRQVELLQNAPNPFSQETALRLQVTEATTATLTIYDALGRAVATPLSEAVLTPGLQAIPFDASALPSGLYVTRLETNGTVQVRKMTVVR
ncbi:MAG: T9SS type A sorting domain-containing protein [Bacteroidota bacterium]